MAEETIPFDRYELDSIIQEIEVRLAELAYIDKALEYIRVNDGTDGTVSEDELEEISIHLGELYPFVRTLRLPEMWNNQATVNGHLEELAQGSRHWAAGNVVTLVDHANWITHPAVETYDRIVNDLKKVHGTLVHDLGGDFAGLANNLRDWKGDAAEEFADKFYSPFGDVLENQAYFASSLARSLVRQPHLV